MKAPVENLYAMIKPPPAALAAIDRLRRTIGLSDLYAADRLHVTIRPFGDIGGLAAADRVRIIAMLSALDLDIAPFRLGFDRVSANALPVREGGRAIARLRRTIDAALAPFGPVHPFRNRPHLSLSYGEAHRPASRIDPIAFVADEIRLVGSLHGQGRHIDYGAVGFRPRQGELFGHCGVGAGSARACRRAPFERRKTGACAKEACAE